jgi:subtilase family serine protease
MESLEQRMLLSGATTIAPLLGSVTAAAATASASSPFTPANVRSAYGVDRISFGSSIVVSPPTLGFRASAIQRAIAGDGAGQTIAIIDSLDDPNILADANYFSSTYGLPQFNSIPGGPTLQVLNEDGGTTLPTPAVRLAVGSDWTLEESLDVQWAHAIAPRANIIVFEASGANPDDLIAHAVNTARNWPGVSVISMSWGGAEFAGETSYDSYFTTPTGHQGVTFVASTGDAGSPGEYPAASPNVVAVGGTTLTLASSSGGYGGESGWAGSGGGQSPFEYEPAYQHSVQAIGARTTPDVSMLADPSPGVWIYDSWTEGPGWYAIGGTSLSCPMWAGLIAIANQGRGFLYGYGSLDGPTQTLPALYVKAMSSGDFNDITTGSNGGYTAQGGYDMVTGLGSPRSASLEADLASVPPPKTVTGVYPPPTILAAYDLAIVAAARTAFDSFPSSPKFSTTLLASIDLSRGDLFDAGPGRTSELLWP